MKVLQILVISASPLLADISLDPTFHFNGVIGDTSADSLSEIGGHAHDPNNNFAVQGLEPGLNLRVDDWLAGFTNINVFTDSNHEIDWELEEAFLKFKNLPGGFELRGGRMLARMGLQNNQHLHAWTLVNSNLTTSQFLGEEGLMSEGTELTWRKDFDRGFFAISSNFSNTASHHHHGDDDFEGEERVKFLSHTIDTRHDSVEVLKNYASKIEVSAPKWNFVTGSKEDIYGIAESYLASAAEDPNSPGGYIHSGAFVLIDPNNHIRGYYDGTQPQAVEKLKRELKALLKNDEKLK